MAQLVKRDGGRDLRDPACFRQRPDLMILSPYSAIAPGENQRTARRTGRDPLEKLEAFCR